LLFARVIFLFLFVMQKIVFSHEVLNLLNGRNFASLATIMPNGYPQVTPIWIDYDENHDLLVNTALGRSKERNTIINDKVGLSIFSMANPYETASIIGNVIDKTTEGADHHFNKLSKKYLNLDEYPIGKPEERRVILKIRSKKVIYVSIPLSTYL
jgi:PPOX class probable F420-dependent enzyme